MKLSCLLLICLTNILLRVTAYALISGDEFLPSVLLAGLLAFFLVSLQNRRSLTGVTAVATSTTTVPQLRCNDGYTLYPGPGRSFCFRFSADCRSWDEAQTACQMESGDLVVLDDESLTPFCRALTPYLLAASNCGEPIAYLGAKIDDMAVARYINGRTIPLDNPIWAPGLPYSPNSCVGAALRNNNVFLLRGTCSTLLRYVCQQF